MDLIQNQSRIARSGQSRRLGQMVIGEHLKVSCAKCQRSITHGKADLRHFPQEVPLTHFEETLPPRCWGFMEMQPADCPREVTWLDASGEDVGVSEEG